MRGDDLLTNLRRAVIAPIQPYVDVDEVLGIVEGEEILEAGPDVGFFVVGG